MPVSHIDKEKGVDSFATLGGKSGAEKQASPLAALEQAKSLKITKNSSLPEVILVSLAETGPKAIAPLRQRSDSSTQDRRVKVQG